MKASPPTTDIGKVLKLNLNQVNKEVDMSQSESQSPELVENQEFINKRNQKALQKNLTVEEIGLPIQSNVVGALNKQPGKLQQK